MSNSDESEDWAAPAATSPFEASELLEIDHDTDSAIDDVEGM